ncbi:magnesium transporter MgtE N-terminal domain-containing protein [Mycolicibacterium aromaticivorans]|uniref:magnesium transporter MgtE N-terminal domain-containing protein n=1 Tax=Mycolicibacterium aromaticivorans TaxID=318425 RepID=UPI000567C086|nr:CBS domain-containing protein [Mycolicibacterium aromaticivorans]
MSDVLGALSGAGNGLRRRGAVRAQRMSTRRGVQQAVVSVAGLVSAPVSNQAGQLLGRVVDLIAHMQPEEHYPPVTGLLVRVGSRRSFLPADAIGEITPRAVRLRTARMDLRDFARRPGEVLLAEDVLDHQLIDLEGRQVLRAADLYLARMGDQFRLVGLDVSFATLLRRLGPRVWRGRPTPERVIDWAAVAPFGDVTASPSVVHLRTTDEQLRRLAPADLADLLEDLARPARQQLLDRLGPDAAADALEEMEPDELEALLREAPPEQAAVLIAAMEPDEAVDALRDLSSGEREELLRRMPQQSAQELTALLTYPEDTAGGFMTSVLARASITNTVGEVERIVAGHREHRAEIDGILIYDEDGFLVADLPLFDLIAYPDDNTIAEVLDAEGHPPPLTVSSDANVGEVATQLVKTRRASLLVVDSDGCPIGRILADDVLDALLPERGRFHFPRLLS